jgi:ABC-type phosphate transport system substrate-binding protein
VRLLLVLVPLIAAFIGIVGGIVTGLRFLRPGRVPRPRRMVNYRVHYDDLLGARTDIKGMAELVVRRRGHDVPDASLVMIRLSNEGGLDIGKEHWVMPVNFTFDGRDVVGVEVSDTDGVPPGLLAGDQDPGPDATADGESIRISKGRKALELPRIELNRKNRIRLLVLLSGQREHAGPAVQGDAYIKGAVRGGGLVREVTPGKERFYIFGWTGLALLSLVATVLLTLIVRPFSSAPQASDCARGSIVVSGSTAFAPALTSVAQQYMAVCPSATVTVSAGGSLGGVSALQANGGSSATIRASDLVMSDGKATPAGDYPNLVGHPVATVIFAVVVNRATGVYSLTQAQLAGIWSGQYTNWDQLKGNNRPIDIVSRDTNSGTRATFDHKILQLKNTTELGPSSVSCVSKDLNPAVPIIRCEKHSTGELLEAVNNIMGAIGYAEAAEASPYKNIDVIQIDRRNALASAVKAGEYNFWATEYLYTYGTPAAGSLLSQFLNYMDTPTAENILQSPGWGDIPCSLSAACGG